MTTVVFEKTEAVQKYAGVRSERLALLNSGSPGGSLRARRLQRQQEAAVAERRDEQKAKEDVEGQMEAEREAEKRQREAERKEQRQLLLRIQEDLKRVREAKARAAAEDDKK